ARVGHPSGDHREGAVPGLAGDRGSLLVPGCGTVEPGADGPVRARLPRDARASVESPELRPRGGLRQPCLRFLDPPTAELAATEVRGRAFVHGTAGEPLDPRHRLRLEPDRADVARRGGYGSGDAQAALAPRSRSPPGAGLADALALRRR